jgi:2-methylisocitrate lyase-like PEP mutase family enzyme
MRIIRALIGEVLNKQQVVRFGMVTIHAKREPARSTSDRLGVPMWINARTDVFLVGPIANKVAEVRERASVYAAARANSLFVPGLIDTSIIAG